MNVWTRLIGPATLLALLSLWAFVRWLRDASVTVLVAAIVAGVAAALVKATTWAVLAAALVALAGACVEVDDADADPTNEVNAALGLTGTTLSITDGGGTLSVDLASLAGGAATGAEILAALADVDGAGSGLDADLLDRRSGRGRGRIANLR